jgi:hypothetical protein
MNHVILLAFVAALFTASTAAAQEKEDILLYSVEQVVVCSENGAGLIRLIRSTWDEDLLFTSDSTTYIVDEQGEQKKLEGKLMVLANQDNGTHTVVMLYPGGTVCEILSGTNFEPYVGERQ